MVLYSGHIADDSLELRHGVSSVSFFSFVFLLLIFVFGSMGMSGQCVVSGVVADSDTRHGIEGASVTVAGLKRFVMTDSCGYFRVVVPGRKGKINISAVGYRPLLRKVTCVSDAMFLDTLFIDAEAATLDEVVVHNRRHKYSKKNNPAVDFVRKLRAESGRHNPYLESFYSYDVYEKMILGMNVEHPERFDTATSRFIDYSPVTGLPYLTLSLKEQHGRQLHRRSPSSDILIIDGYKSNGIDEDFNTENMRKMISDVLREINIYGNDITVLQNRFVSPLSRIGPDFYKYYLTDTVTIGVEPCIELMFAPHNRESMGFRGRIYVPLGDTTMFVRKVVMDVPRDINLNYVRGLNVVQTFEKDSLGHRHKTSDYLTVRLQVLPGTPEIYARRETLYDMFSYEPQAEMSAYYDIPGKVFVLPSALERDDAFWGAARLTTVTSAQREMGGFMGVFKRKKLFLLGQRVVTYLEKGYIGFGHKPKFDIGPLNTIVSVNDVEGVRFRLGGMTTANLSPHWFTRFYGAYGLKDHRWKYSAELDYSFSAKNYHSREFPMHLLRGYIKYDVDQLGQHYLFTNPDNLFLSLKRHDNYLMTYKRECGLKYFFEHRNGFSLEVGFRHERQMPTSYLPFVLGDGRELGHYNLSTFKVSLRYAPGEEFYQSASVRLPINMDAPIIILSHEFGPKGFLGSDFTLNKTELSVQKRFWFSAFGYLDMILRGAMIWSGVYYPSLTWANANLSYTIQPESFALMDPMEFATDRYASWDLTYWMNGLILNRIPFIKEAKLREVVSFRGYWGKLSNRNKPWLHDDLLRLPADANVRELSGTPYMELGVGLDNIFTFLRLDYVWRLSYRDTLSGNRSGVRISLHFSF